MVAMSTMRRRVLGGVAAAILVVAGCGGSDDADSGDEGEATEAGTDGTADDGTTAPDGTTDEDGAGGAADVPEVYADFSSEQYEVDENWLCRPDLAEDLCRVDLDVTTISADGSTEVTEIEPAVDAPVDCFYVYPTVNFGGGEEGLDLAMADDISAEAVVVATQAAPFSELCNVYAPIYRQVTLDGFGVAGDEGFATAYGDVRDAFAHYMANWNEGRPVILIGHSQGSGHLLGLLQDDFDDDDDLRSRLVSALLIGGRVEVPDGEVVGGSLSQIPLCTASEQTGCVIAYNSIAAAEPPDGSSSWAGVETEGNVRACTNPAALGGGSAPLHSRMVSTGNSWSTDPAVSVSTPYAAFEGGVTGECVVRDGLSYFEITPAGEEGDARGIAELSTPRGFWALHIVDVNLAFGDLLEVVRTQIEATTGG